MKKLFQLLSIAMLLPVAMQAQDLTDALRYSNLQVQGTARAGAMGNAFGALGGDFTSVSINPAGLGLYRSGELTFTPSFRSVNVESNYFSNTMSDNSYKFAFNNLSYVAAIPTQNSETGIVGINIGIGYNRLKDFSGSAIAGTSNANGSFLDYAASRANAFNFNPDGNNPYISDFYERLAWETDLLLREDDTGVYWHDVEDAGYGQTQRKSISRDGSVNEYSLGVGLNFNHKLYMGVSLGIVDVYYREASQLFESDASNTIPYFNNMEYESYLRTSGTGYNGKFGVIYKPTNEIRLGASVHTPTFFNLHDIFETSLVSSVTYDSGPESFDAYSPYSEYDYDLETPLKATVSGAFVIKKAGLISIDYEFINYGSASLRRGGDGYNFMDENEEIKEVYKSVGNLRLGGELLVSDNVSLRAGYEYHPSPYNEQALGATQPNSDANLNVYSAGIGYRQGGFFADIAYRYSDITENDMLYPQPVTGDYPSPQLASFNTVKNNVLFTLGFKF